MLKIQIVIPTRGSVARGIRCHVAADSLAGKQARNDKS